ncbi:MAG: hypothetical protein HY903_17760 [Deltaproteobacteria bacterium]|nr:hypothetical protein [Deltaproteobacteria bacterium]
MVISYRTNRGRGQTVTRDVGRVAPQVQGRIIGSGDIDVASRSMSRDALSAWLSQSVVFTRLTANARQNVRRRGL